jgi:hypothetical protein
MSQPLMNTIELPPEIWSKIILHTKPSYKELMQLSTVSQKFRRLILNRWFLNMCFAKYPILTRDLILHVDFSNVTDTPTNPLINSIHGARGVHDRLSENNEGMKIETSEIFDRVLTFYSTETTYFFNVFIFDKSVSNAFSISLWFLHSSEGKIIFHFCHRHYWWSVEIDIDVEQQMKIRTFFNGKLSTIDAGKRAEHIWHHLAITRFKTSLHFYINGQLINKTQLNGWSHTHFDTLRISGCFSNNSSIADIAVWNRRLLPEIKSIYQQKTSIRQAVLIEGLLNGL